MTQILRPSHRGARLSLHPELIINLQVAVGKYRIGMGCRVAWIECRLACRCSDQRLQALTGCQSPSVQVVAGRERGRDHGAVYLFRLWRY